MPPAERRALERASREVPCAAFHFPRVRSSANLSHAYRSPRVRLHAHHSYCLRSASFSFAAVDEPGRTVGTFWVAYLTH